MWNALQQSSIIKPEFPEWWMFESTTVREQNNVECENYYYDLVNETGGWHSSRNRK